MSLVWGREPARAADPRPAPQVWAWCPACNGTGDHEFEGREGMADFEACAMCGGEGGWFEGAEAA